MKLLTQILTLYNWGVVCILLLFLYSIARFFEQRLFEKTATKKKLSIYPLLFVSMAAFVISAIIYTFFGPLIVGNLAADTLRLIGGAILIFVCYTLLNSMMGGRS